MRKYISSIILLGVFLAIGIVLWVVFDHLFYFAYIGIFIFLGAFLKAKKSKYARRIVQFGVGLYMFVFLGILNRENMQIEGFWYYFFMGVFQATVIHYGVAKILGPFIFGRGWCGYACWTAAILDLLPYKVPSSERKNLEFIRYIVFVSSIIFVGALYLFKVANIERIMFLSFIIGNIIYYVVGILLAFKFKDNRAFCKYICPITVFLKPASYYALIRVKVDVDKCIECGKCKKVCMMNVDITDNSRKRINGTECILCGDCKEVCPTGAISF